MQNVIDVLKERGFVESLTSEELKQIVNKPLSVYCGFDPTSDGLHLGNMVPIMGLAWFQRCGHTPIAIVGGATGMIGDPSGKSSERQLLTAEIIAQNLKGIQADLEKILKQSDSHKAALFLNNYDWFRSFSFIDLLRDVGKYFRVGPMLAKESVKARMNSEEGMSFTEFSYQVLQAYDFLHLFQTHGVLLQMGGSDQWGNITAGTELIRKVTGATAFGLTFPLLVRSDGQKFGKSEKGAIWLSSQKLSYYDFYQYLFRVTDEDVIKLMRLLTFMDMKEIEHYEKLMRSAEYVPNTAQRKLAEEVTRIVHGEEGLKIALRVTMGAAPGAKTDLDVAELEAISADMPSFQLPRQEVMDAKLIDILVKVGLQESKGDARRLIRNGGVAVNNEKVIDENYTMQSEQFIENRLLLLSIGRKKKLLLKIMPE
jgi:tyrosyl-tRNA synthetase